MKAESIFPDPSEFGCGRHRVQIEVSNGGCHKFHVVLGFVTGMSLHGVLASAVVSGGKCPLWWTWTVYISHAPFVHFEVTRLAASSGASLNESMAHAATTKTFSISYRITYADR